MWAGFSLFFFFFPQVILKHFMALKFKLCSRMRHLIVTFFFLRMGATSYESFVYNHALEKKKKMYVMISNCLDGIL